MPENTEVRFADNISCSLMENRDLLRPRGRSERVSGLSLLTKERLWHAIDLDYNNERSCNAIGVVLFYVSSACATNKFKKGPTWPTSTDNF